MIKKEKRPRTLIIEKVDETPPKDDEEIEGEEFESPGTAESFAELEALYVSPKLVKDKNLSQIAAKTFGIQPVIAE